MKIALIVAMDKEFAQLRSLLENEKAETHRNITFVTGTIGTHQLVLLQCGIGKVNSTIGAVVTHPNWWCRRVLLVVPMCK